MLGRTTPLIISGRSDGVAVGAVMVDDGEDAQCASRIRRPSDPAPACSNATSSRDAGNKTGFSCVYRNNAKYQAKVKVLGFEVCLGTFVTPQQAALEVARHKAKEEVEAEAQMVVLLLGERRLHRPQYLGVSPAASSLLCADLRALRVEPVLEDCAFGVCLIM